jgi:hypothetical protein
LVFRNSKYFSYVVKLQTIDRTSFDIPHNHPSHPTQRPANLLSKASIKAAPILVPPAQTFKR